MIQLAPGKPRILSHEAHGRLVLDGDVILPADGQTINARRKIAQSGYMAITLVADARQRLAAPARVLAKGVPVEEDEEAFLGECADASEAAFRKAGMADLRRLEDEVKVAVRRVARQWTGKKPVTDVQIIALKG
jgi:ribonuclease J